MRQMLKNVWTYTKRALAVAGLLYTTNCGDAPLPPFTPSCPEGKQIKITSPSDVITPDVQQHLNNRITTELPESLCDLVDEFQYVSDIPDPAEVDPSKLGPLSLLRRVPTNHNRRPIKFQLDLTSRVLYLEQDQLDHGEFNYPHKDMLYANILLALASGVDPETKKAIVRDLLTETQETLFGGFADNEAEKYASVVIGGYVTNASIGNLLRAKDELLVRLEANNSPEEYEILKEEVDKALGNNTLKLYASVRDRIFDGKEFFVHPSWQEVLEGDLNMLQESLKVFEVDGELVIGSGVFPSQVDRAYRGTLDNLTGPEDGPARNHVYGILLRNKLGQRGIEVFEQALRDGVEVSYVRGLEYLEQHFDPTKSPIFDPGLANIVDQLALLGNPTYLTKRNVYDEEGNSMYQSVPLQLRSEILETLKRVMMINFDAAYDAANDQEAQPFLERNRMALDYAISHDLPLIPYICDQGTPWQFEVFGFCE